MIMTTMTVSQTRFPIPAAADAITCRVRPATFALNLTLVAHEIRYTSPFRS